MNIADFRVFFMHSLPGLSVLEITKDGNLVGNFMFTHT